MKKHIISLMLIACVILSGCMNAGTEHTSQSEQTDRTTMPLETTDDEEYIKASLSEEEQAAAELEMHEVVWKVIADKTNSDEFLKLESDEEKADMLIEVLKDLSINGTEEYPYPLVMTDSWSYYSEDREIEFQYIDGIKAYITLYNVNDPYAPDQTVILPEG